MMQETSGVTEASSERLLLPAWMRAEFMGELRTIPANQLQRFWLGVRLKIKLPLIDKMYRFDMRKLAEGLSDAEVQRIELPPARLSDTQSLIGQLTVALKRC
jgi:hypothetical protein